MKNLPHRFLVAIGLVLGFTFSATAKTPDGKTCVLLLAGKPSHGPGAHEHNAGVQLLAKCLAQGAPGVVTKVHLNHEWPAADELAQADAILLYSDGGGGHIALKDERLSDLAKEMKRGCGLLCLHYAVEPAFEKVGWPEPKAGPDGKPLKQEIPPGRSSKGKGAPEFLDWLGGYFEQFWSVNPHWTANFKELPKRPISSGVKPFSTNDEWYFHMRFRAGMQGVTPILSDVPPVETTNRGEGSHAGNPDMKRAVLEEKKPQHVAWAVERADGGRGFGFTGGHFHAGWGNDDQRKLVLNAILWTAKVAVPANGVESKITAEDLAANLDPKGPKKPAPASAPAPAPAKPEAKPSADANPGVTMGFAAAKENMARFKTAEGLSATLMASEPMIQNPTNIDIDPQGRVWAVECVNYRTSFKPWGQLREGGDRVVILADTNGDGVSDKETTFYQSKDITNPLGICVLPQDKGTQVIVSAAPNVWLLTDEDGDDKADKAEIIAKVKGNWDHDHQVHAFVFGTDGKFYFNCGNEFREFTDPEGKPFTDLNGRRTVAERKPYQQGIIFRADLKDGKLANIETLAWNFRNNYEVCVDSFGTMWQSDNDDDGNKGVRINYVMDFGNFGYSDEVTGSGWRTPRPNIETEIPKQHWHQNDPGSIPNLLQTGGGSPTGILIDEGAALGPQFQNQLIHCDAGPRTVRVYPVETDGAGYRAEMVDILTSEDPWYRPADVAIAPDGSLVIADWYDAGVGGHNMADHDKGQIRGRLYRVAPSGGKLTAPAPDFSTASGNVAALQSPNPSTVYVAWQKLVKLGAKAEPELVNLWKDEVANPRHRARALGILARLPNGADYLRQAVTDGNSDLRITAIRLSTTLERTNDLKAQPAEGDKVRIEKLLRDPSAQVRRQIAVSLYGKKDSAPIWAILAQQHDGNDRWYLEALGIGASGNEDACFDAWFALAKGNWNTSAGRDIIWRLRSSKTAQYLAKLLEDKSVAAADKPRYVRSLDFLPESPEKTKTLVQLAGLGGDMNSIAAEALTRLKNVDLNTNPDVKAALEKQLAATKGTPRFIEIARDFKINNQGAAVLDAALAHLSDPLANEGLKLVLTSGEATKLFDDVLAGPNAEKLVTLLGTSSEVRIINRLTKLATDAKGSPASRKAAIQALARTQTGAQAVIQLAKNSELPEELRGTATTALNLVQYPALKTDIATLFPAPAALGGKPLPPIAELVKLKGDLARGKIVTERVESSCTTCHKIGDKGVDFAPALSEIGTKLPKEALYDAIINPNTGISMGFETTQLQTRDGSLAIGIIRSETNDEVVLALPGGATNKFTKREIAKREKLATSLMPSGLNQALSQQDLVDMVEYLVSLKKP